MLKCGDFYKDNKVKTFLNEAQEVGVKKYGFSPKYNSSKRKGAEKRPPYNLTTLMYQLIVKR